jgi:acetylornithine deacetylase
LVLTDATEILAKLVGFDTTSAKSNLPLIDFVREYLAGHGVDARLVPSEDGNKSSLFATIGREGNGIGLSGHSDCVPIEGQNWTSDPLALRARDGKLYGRGACDMKGFLACVLTSVPRFQAHALKEPVHIIISYDEEVGCRGVRPLIARLGADLPRPRIVIVGEPSRMEVIDAHKRIDAYRTTVTGREAHSGVPQRGVNAIAYAAELIIELIWVGKRLEAKECDPRFDPPYSTLQVGIIRGGTAGNIVPKTCTFDWEVRSLLAAKPEVASDLEKDTNALLKNMRQVAPGASIITAHSGSVPAFQAPKDSKAVALALALTHMNETHAVPYGTEAGLFEEAGCEAVICGPGSVEQAHSADEFVAQEQLDACMAFLDRLAEQLRA